MSALDTLARIQRVIAILSLHPDGLSLAVLAEELEVAEPTLRREILNYYSVDVPADQSRVGQRPEVVEFISTEGESVEPQEAPVVRLAGDAAEAELAGNQFSDEDLAQLLQAAISLAEMEPENEVLSAGIERLNQLLRVESAESFDEAVVSLRRAIEEQIPVEIEYSREWQPGVRTRVVHPYSLLRTNRGWELDAGPFVAGHARTYILSRIRSLQLQSGQRFERPSDVDRILKRDRRAERVQLLLPQGSHWVADRFAERTEVVDADSDDLVLDAFFLPPVAERVGLVLLIAGPDAGVLKPERHAGAAAELAERLREHHGLADRS